MRTIEKPLFWLTFTAELNLSSHEDLLIDSEITAAEAYQNGVDEILTPSLQLLSPKILNEFGSIFVFQNSPNPFKDETRIPFIIEKNGRVDISIYDISGSIISEHSEIYQKGLNEFHLDEFDIPRSGIYVIQFNFGAQKLSKKLLKISN